MSYRLRLILIICFGGQTLFAQTNSQLRKNLSGLIFKINNADSLGIDPAALSHINQEFEMALIKYARVSPKALNEALHAMNAVFSDDNNFCIYSWDTNLGGTQHFYESAFLYSTPNGLKLKLDTLSDKEIPTRCYDKVYTIKSGGQPFYLATYNSVVCLGEYYDGIQGFEIENNTLNDNVKVIKTTRGLTNKLSYHYFQTMDNDNSFLYDSKSQTISFPIVDKSLHKTDGTITYKFTGRYFEKVKN